VLLVGLLAALPGLATAQSGPPVLTINQVLTEEFPQVVSYVTVVDSSGLPLADVTEAALTVSEDGADVGQFVLSPASQEGVQIILAVDSSGSMLGGSALSDAQAAARTFLSQLGPEDEAALIVFAEQADIVQDFTADTESLETAIDGLAAVPNARTALYEAAFEASERMVQVPPGRKAILILTDGTDTVGGFTLKDAIDKAQEANVPIYTVGLLGGEFDPAPMRQLAEATGGFYLEAPASDELSARFRQVRQLLEQQIAIRFTSGLRPDDRFHDLGIRVTLEDASGEDHRPFLPLPLIPWVEFITPVEGDEVAGTVPVAVNVAAREPIAELLLAAQGEELARLVVSPYRHHWDSAALTPGSYVVEAQATDAAGRIGRAEVVVQVRSALSIMLKTPTDGQDVVGLVEVRPDIQAVRKIRQVVVTVDGVAVETLTAAPYMHVWDTGSTTLGQHVLTVTVEDDVGLTAQAQARVNVLPALSLTLAAPADGSDVVGVVDVQPDIQAARALREVVVSVDGTAVATVPAPPYTYRWDTAELPAGSHRVEVRAEDETGLVAQAEAQVNVLPVVTTTWVSPQPGDEMTATVTLVAQAQAHYGVERVEFTSDGQLLGAVKDAPYELEWSTLELEEKDYQMSACGYDVLGHRDCADITLPLRRPGPGAVMILALGFLLLAIVLVTAMVIRTRQRQAAARAPAPVPPPLVVEGAGTDVGRVVAREARTAVGQPALRTTPGERAFFVVQPAGGGPTWEADLGPGEVVIGRAADSGVRIDDDLASRRHAIVRFDADMGSYVFRDLTPTNPTIINGEEYRGPHRLRGGDSIVVGTTVLTFHQGSS
jgi:VWFA-related protein